MTQRSGLLFRDVGWLRAAWIGWEVEAAVIHGTEAPLYTVEYEAGYILPGEDGATLPAAIEEACIVTCADWYQKSARGTGNIKSKKVGDLSIEYQQSSEGQFTTVKVEAIPASGRALLPVRVL